MISFYIFDNLTQAIEFLAAAITILSALHGFVNIPLRNRKLDAPILFDVIGLWQKDRRRFQWLILKTVIIFFSIVLIILFGLVLRFYLAYGVRIDTSMIVMFILIIGIPIVMLSYVAYIEYRIRRGLGSRVRKSLELELRADYATLFLRCQRILSDMGGRLSILDAVNGVTAANLRGNLLSIKICSVNYEYDHYLLSITSESSLPSVIFDFGANAYNVSEFTHRLLGLK